jgi:protein-disulfide isomerase
MFESQKTSRTTLRICAIGLVTLLTLMACSGQKAAPARSGEDQVVDSPAATEIGLLSPGEPLTGVPVEADDAQQGSPTALVTVVGFLDFECSFCAMGFDTLQQLRGKYSDADLRIVFKHLPLQSHQHAVPAAIAGQAVQDVAGSDAFFQFADLAFKNGGELSYQNLAEWAKAAGAPPELYNEAAGNEQTLRRVAQDAGLAQQLGVDSTPAFYINGQLLSGAQPIEVFEQTIEQEIAAMKASGTSSWRDTYQARVATNMKASLVTALLAQEPHDLKVPIDDSPALGSKDALVTLVMFTDFECPYCKRGEDTVRKLQGKYKENLRIIFKHLPLPFHQRARPAALLAAQIYEKKGASAFFSAAQQLFSVNDELSDENLTQIGKAHGLSKNEIELSLRDQNPALSERLERDRILADDVEARGTPHFFINGKRLTGARPASHFEALIEYELKRAQALVAQGTKPAQVYETLQKTGLSPGAPTKITFPIPIEGQPTHGSHQAPVTVHIFSDFECPYCQKGERDLLKLSEAYPSQLRFVWHDLPLPFHDRARPAARAGRYVFSKKGASGFWKMHAALFNLEGDQAQLSDEEIVEHAKQLGLGEAQLRAALTDESWDEGIDADIARGSASPPNTKVPPAAANSTNRLTTPSRSTGRR